MITNNAEPEPSGNPQTGAIDVNSPSPQLAADNARRGLLEEILTLLKSGSNPSRLKQLMRENDVEQVRRIDESLGLDPAKLMKKAAEQCAEYLDFTEPLRRELARPDLTIPEALRLAKFVQRLDRLIKRSLMLQRLLLEKRLSGTQVRQAVHRLRALHRRNPTQSMQEPSSSGPTSAD